MYFKRKTSLDIICIVLYTLCVSHFAGVAELVDALDLGSSDESRRGSSPFIRTIWFFFMQVC